MGQAFSFISYGTSRTNAFYSLKSMLQFEYNMDIQFENGDLFLVKNGQKYYAYQEITSIETDQKYYKIKIIGNIG